MTVQIKAERSLLRLLRKGFFTNMVDFAEAHVQNCTIF